jgi:hypothetical protein
VSLDRVVVACCFVCFVRFPCFILSFPL